MTKKKKKVFFQFKITLKNSKPPIWRRIVVPAEYTFQEFAEVIMTAMGWTGLHLSDFKMKEGTLINVNFPMDDGGFIDDFDDDINATEVELVNYLDAEEKFIFVYDFGDDWEHVVLLEKVLDDFEKDYPVVLKFKGNCPPEDCGGIFWYYKLLEADEETRKEYFDEVEDYNIDEVNESLKECFSGEIKSMYGTGENIEKENN